MALSTKSLIFKIRSFKEQRKEIPKDLITALKARGYYIQEYPDKVDIININDTIEYFKTNDISMTKIKKLTRQG